VRFLRNILWRLSSAVRQMIVVIARDTTFPTKKRSCATLALSLSAFVAFARFGILFCYVVFLGVLTENWQTPVDLEAEEEVKKFFEMFCVLCFFFLAFIFVTNRL
jgi:hypothetical protein